MNILLYAPDLAGHPQVYCKVIIDSLIDQVDKIVLACCRCEPFQWANWTEILPFQFNQKIEIIDCSTPSNSYLRAEDILEIQLKHSIESTIFVEGDKFRNEFIKIYRRSSPRLRGKNIAIFSRTQAWYPGEDFYSGYPLPKFAPTLRQNVGRLKRLILTPETWDIFFYEQILIKNKVIDALLVKDDRISEKFGKPVYWMPEIFRPFNLDKNDNDQQFIKYANQFIDFWHSRSGCQILLFFGTGSWYRGYDLFLKLIEDDPEIIGVHCGAPVVYEQGKPFLFDLDLIKQKLKYENRLFETNCYVSSWQLIDFFYKYSTCAVSTHRLTGSSGTVLQALQCQNPVLVPGTGLLGYQNIRYGLGQTYQYLNCKDLLKEWLAFKSSDHKLYLESLTLFMDKFSQDNVIQFFQKLIFES
ncbi:MAG: hypothetical protein LVS60_14005 [Nodosilinea sp. LVE1205-7]|jgi:hypothetical protein